jgi:glycine cleavage system aminomethyltransferase T
MTTTPGSPPLARSPLHHRHVALGARLGAVDGWQVPLGYGDTAAELAAARTGAALADVTAFPRLGPLGNAAAQHDLLPTLAGFWLFGPHTEQIIPRLSALNGAALPEGGCAETAFAGVHALLLRPPGTPVPSLRLWVAWDVAEYVWDRILEAGRGAVVLLGHDALRELLRGADSAAMGAS